jgi:hypothetical protein
MATKLLSGELLVGCVPDKNANLVSTCTWKGELRIMRDNYYVFSVALSLAVAAFAPNDEP